MHDEVGSFTPSLVRELSMRAARDTPPTHHHAHPAVAVQAGATWCAEVTDFGGRVVTEPQQAALRARFEPVLPFRGAVRLRAPDIHFLVLLDFHAHNAAPSGGAAPAPAVVLAVAPAVAEPGAPASADVWASAGLPEHTDGDNSVSLLLAGGRLRRVFAGVRHASSRRIVSELRLSSRAYLGPTSLDPEMALTLCNLARVRRGGLVLEPFMGTGSVGVAAARLGAVTVGSDIDWRVICAGKRGRGVASNYAQYALPPPELLRADVARLPLRTVSGGLFDAIVTDPPYGVRAAAVGGSSGSNAPVAAATDVITELLHVAARQLRLGGRLAFLLSACRADYDPDGGDMPTHACLTLEHDVEEPLSLLLSRRLVCLVKTSEYDPALDAQYRADAAARSTRSRAAGEAEGTALRARVGAAYDAWVASRLHVVAAPGRGVGPASPAAAALLAAAVTAARGPALLDRAASAGTAGEEESTSQLPDTAAVHAMAEAAAATDAAGGGEVSGGAQLGDSAPNESRSRRRAELRRVERQLFRLERARAAAAGERIAPSKTAEKARAANARYRAAIAAGDVPEPISQAPFQRSAQRSVRVAVARPVDPGIMAGVAANCANDPTASC